MGTVIGIDLGTTNSVAAALEGGVPTIIPSAEGGRLFPSVVAVDPRTAERVVGQVARRQAVVNPHDTIFSVKRFMGRKFADPEVARARGYVPYQVRQAANGDVRVVMAGRTYAPPAVAAMILQKIRRDAEAYLGQSVTEAVITVPAYFNDSQRQATRAAGRIAGLDVLRILNEPTASALAYGLGSGDQGIVAVYDLGGGTFDISILEMGDGVFEVLATNGDTFLGGDDFDQRIIDWAAEQFLKAEGIDLRQDRQALQRLRVAAEEAKVALSTTLQSDINLPYITAGDREPRHLDLRLSRARLEQLVEDLIARTVEPVKGALRDAGLTPDDVDAVLLVGGMTRMPAVQRAVEGLFGRTPHRSVNPDEVVAAGAALQAGVLRGEINDLLLLDVTPLSLGIETLGGVFTCLIERNTTVPTRQSQVFSTASDDQARVDVHVLQGERPMAADNKSLGRFILDQIPPAPRGVPQIEVSFDIDADGILHVAACDTATGREQALRIVPSSGLTEREVARMMREAEEHAARDRRRKEAVEQRNMAEAVIYNAERLVREYGRQLPPAQREMLQERLAATRAALESETTLLRAEADALQAALQEAGAALYTRWAGRER